jgi:hypothetical protein
MLHVEPGSAAGFCLGEADDQIFALLRRTAYSMRLEVHRLQKDAWSLLAARDLPAPDWRRDGWFPLQVRPGADLLTAAVGDLALQVDNARMGKVAGLALCVINDGPVEKPAELRAFHLLH